MNQEVIAELGARVGLADDVANKERVRQMLALATELRKELASPLSAEEIRESMEEGRR